MNDETPSLLEEAQAAIQEISFGVSSASVDTTSSSSEEVILSIVTLEGDSYRVSLTTRGYLVVEQNQRVIPNNDANIRVESIYALLDKLSPLYRDSFGKSLIGKLAALSEASQTANSN